MDTIPFKKWFSSQKEGLFLAEGAGKIQGKSCRAAAPAIPAGGWAVIDFCD
jgi:hypothetical protein